MNAVDISPISVACWLGVYGMIKEKHLSLEKKKKKDIF